MAESELDKLRRLLAEGQRVSKTNAPRGVSFDPTAPKTVSAPAPIPYTPAYFMPPTTIASSGQVANTAPAKIEDLVGEGQTEADYPAMFPKFKREVVPVPPEPAVVKTGPAIKSTSMFPLPQGGVGDRASRDQIVLAQTAQKDKDAAFKANLQALRTGNGTRAATPSRSVLDESARNMAVTKSGARTVGEKRAAIGAVARGEDPNEAVAKYHSMRKEMYDYSKLSGKERTALANQDKQIASAEKIAGVRTDAQLSIAERKAGLTEDALAAKQESDAAKLEFNKWREGGMQEHRKEKLLMGSEMLDRKLKANALIADQQIGAKLKMFNDDQAQSLSLANARNAITQARNFDLKRKAERDYAITAAREARDVFGDAYKQTLMGLGLQLKAKSQGYKDIEKRIGSELAALALKVAEDDSFGASFFGAAQGDEPAPTQAAPVTPVAPQPAIPQPAQNVPKVGTTGTMNGKRVRVSGYDAAGKPVYEPIQ